jgi:hypothetical protein
VLAIVSNVISCLSRDPVCSLGASGVPLLSEEAAQIREDHLCVQAGVGTVEVRIRHVEPAILKRQRQFLPQKVMRVPSLQLVSA